MKIQISRNEMRILGYLHDQANDFDNRYMFQPDDVAAGVGITKEQLERDTSFLSEHGLVQLKVISFHSSRAGQTASINFKN